jgi:hypothetical protein
MADDRSVENQSIEQQVWRIVGGDFSPDSVGPDEYERTRARVRADASRFLDAFESMFLGTGFDARLQSELDVASLLKIVAEVEPERTRSLADSILSQINSVMLISDEAVDKEALFRLLPEETVNLTTRLERKRAELKAFVGGTE